MENKIKLNFTNDYKNEEKIIVEKIITLQKAILSKNVHLLSEVLSDKFILVRGSGRKETKIEFETDIKEDLLNYYHSTMSKPSIKIVVDKATVITQINITAELSGVTSIWELYSKIILEKIEDDWYIVEWDTS